MSASCCTTQPKFDGMSRGFRRALWIVIAINAAMFAVEMTAGALSGSQALQADALGEIRLRQLRVTAQPTKHVTKPGSVPRRGLASLDRLVGSFGHAGNSRRRVWPC